MSHDHRPVESFVARVRARLNRHRMWTTLVWSIVAVAGALVLAGLWYTLRGYAVPRAAILSTAGLGIVGFLAAWRVRLLNVERAAGASDQFYRLHDAISSYLHFSRAGRSGGYYALQAEQTRARVEPLDPAEIKYEPPRRGMLLAACLVAIALPLSLRGPSLEVLQRQRLELETRQATAVINESLEKTIDELEKATGDDEKELLDPSKLREWVQELQETGDHKEALRQYAELERKLNEARLAVQNKRDEQLLDRAARELEQTRETQPLADELKQKNYEKAGEQLAKMGPQESSKPLDQQRKELARLKAASQHLAAAARASRTSAKNAKSSAGTGASKNPSASSQAGSGSQGQSEPGGTSSDGGGDMAQAMEDLAAAVSELDEALRDAERQEKREGQCDAEKKEKCQSCQQSVANQLAKLNRQLKKLAMCRQCDSRLAKLCQMCSQCQGGLCQAAAMCQSPKAGGREAGSGSNTARRDARDELVDNGQTTQLQGIKGTGPSQTTVEAAEEGSGTSNRQAAERQRVFQRQFESFVAREDIPEQVKDGVKQYFQIIHEIQPPAK